MKLEYHTEHFDSVEGFIERLSPLNKIITNRRSNFIYRGQADSEWSLVPSLLRDGENNPLRRIAVNEDGKFNRGFQILYEILFIKNFVDACDEIGLVIPGDSYEFRNIIECKFNYKDDYEMGRLIWPDDKLFKIMALAQNQGIPTRLLDWTRNPYVSVYFAASSAIDIFIKKDDFDIYNKNIAIWALDTELKNLYKDSLEIINVPGATSVNLAAQKGCFTCMLSKEEKEGGDDFDIGIDGIEGHHINSLWKFTISASKSIRLLKFCEDIGIMASTLFPGFDGVARYWHNKINMSDRRFRDRIFIL
jgi:hypothetical protein